MDRVAVYGSLRKGMGNHPLLASSEYLGVSTHQLPFTMVSLGAFPALLLADDLHNITVETYEVDQQTMDSLDMLEGYPRFYDRMQLDSLPDTWIYFMRSYRGAPAEVFSGDWVAYCNGV